MVISSFIFFKGLLAIEAIEANLHAPRGTVWEDDSPHEAPVIIQQPQLVGEIEEGTAIHFDVQVEPAADPSLIVEWLVCFIITLL